MTETEYQEWLKKAPQDHFSEEFIQFLRDNTKIVEETDNWLIIENCKDPKDYTAFYIRLNWKSYWYMFISDLQGLEHYTNREWKIKAPHKRSVGLYHVHLIQK